MAFSKEKAHDRAERYAAKGQHDKAAREYLAIVENDPKDVRAWLMLADCLVRCGDRAGAIQRYLQVAAFYASQKQPQKALAVYRQVLNLDPARLDVLLKCAKLNIDLGRRQDAVAAYEQVAQIQLQSGHVAEAINSYKLVADAEPTVVSKRLRLAELYSREKRLNEAVEAFRVAGEQLLAADRKADFVRVAERLIYHRADDKPTIRKLASVYLALGDPRRALMKLNGLLHSDPHDREGLELLAETFIALDKPDKAVSVITELVRELRRHEGGQSNGAQAVLHRGLQWIPGNPDLLRLQHEVSSFGVSTSVRAEPAQADEQEVEELDLDDDDVVELDEDDVVMTDSGSGALPEPEPGAPMEEQPVSLTDTVLSEADLVNRARAEGESSADIDKILFEARVYIKYRLFEHALDHIRDALEQDPHHVGALSLEARALGELGRVQASADSHARVAQLVARTDPKLAREHIAAALAAVPDHMGAVALQADLGIEIDAAETEQAAASGSRDALDDLLDEGDGDSGAIDLVADDLSSEMGLNERDAAADDDAEFDIDVAEPEMESELDQGAPPVAVENRFGLSDAGPLPGDEAPPTAGTPASGFIPRPPPGAERKSAIPDPVEAEEPTGKFQRMRGLGAGLDDLDLDAALDHAQLVDESGRIPRSPADVVIEEDEAVVAERSAAPPPERQPQPALAAAGPPPGGWPDLSDDLAEIRFFLDQGLDDDAAAALQDLSSRHPGHPEIAAVMAEMSGAAAEPASDEGAAPLVLLDDEDAEADAYLESIFGGGDEEKPKRKANTKVVADVEEADARTLFDLGTAYREMGLVDAAIGQFEAAAEDPQWKSRALVMLGTLRVHRGETDQAVADLRTAIETATTDDELSEASYELGVLYEKIGDTGAAIERLKAVSQGFRDRDERLQALLG